jgi:hypothetical protein
VQIANSVSSALSCPLFQGDSLHETAAKAASVGAAAPRRPTTATNAGETAALVESGANEARYQRMWLSKMTRTGLLFPEESRAATKDFAGFGGTSSTSTSRRGLGSSVASSSSDGVVSTSNIASSFTSPVAQPPTTTTQNINKPPIVALSEDEKLRKANPALMVVTHPILEQWHKDSIRSAVGEYGIGVIFVPLYEDEDEELPILKPLDPRTMMSFGSLEAAFGAVPKSAGKTLGEEILLRVNVEAKVGDLAEDIVDGVRDIMDS